MKPGAGDSRRGDDAFDDVRSAYEALPTDEPPRLVDQAVRNRARAALAQPRAWYWNMSWVHGLTTVGVLALAVTLLLQLRGTATEDDAAPPSPSPAMQRSTGSPREPSAAQEPAGSTAHFESRPSEKTGQDDTAFAAPTTTLKVPAQAATADQTGQEGLQERLRADREGGVGEAAAHGVQEDAALPGNEETPEQWLDRIRELAARGQHQEAERELERFMARWPDFPVPPDIRGQ